MAETIRVEIDKYDSRIKYVTKVINGKESQHVVLTCLECKKDYEPLDGSIKGKFCGDECRWEWTKRRKAKRRRERYHTDSEYRTMVRARARRKYKEKTKNPQARREESRKRYERKLAKDKRDSLEKAAKSRTRLSGIRKHLPAKVEKQNGICALCFESLPEDFGLIVIDHILPVAMGGSDHPDNLQAVHQECNLSKGAGQGYTRSG